MKKLLLIAALGTSAIYAAAMGPAQESLAVEARRLDTKVAMLTYEIESLVDLRMGAYGKSYEQINGQIGDKIKLLLEAEADLKSLLEAHPELASD